MNFNWDSTGLKNHGKTFTVSYQKPHTYRGGKTHMRTYSKEVYISGKNPEWDLDSRWRKNRQENRVYGIEVEYTNVVSGSRAERDGTVYRLPEREMQVTKVIPIPKGARNIRVRRKPPKSHMRVA